MPALRVRSGNGSTVRTRILGAVLALTAAALVLSGAIAAAILRAQVIERINEDLAADVQEFATLVDVGVDPSTGEPFESARGALRTSMERVVPEPNEGILGFVGGDLTFVSSAAVLPLEDDREFVDAVARLTTLDRTVFTEIVTSTTRYRVAVAPIDESPSGDLSIAGPGPAPESAPPPDRDVVAQVLAYDQRAEVARFEEAFVIYAWVAAGAFVVVSVLGWLIAGRLLRPVRTLADASAQIGRDDLTERIPVSGHDDLAHMTTSVNSMLDRLEAAFASQRDLLDDVSHELRTPITVIRGHLELMDTADPADAAQVRELAIDELDRMNALVEDLLTLAKADRPDFVTPEAVDVVALTGQILEKARGLGDRVWVGAAEPDGTAYVDPRRITQAVLQLAANAVKFSALGSRIEIGARCSSTEVTWWVADAGVGISPEDQEKIFERFGQVETGRGAGLGLTIVTAIAYAHGGSVSVDSALGQGSTFSVSVPLVHGVSQEGSP